MDSEALGTVEIWTDGGCKPNPGPGGWAAILRYGETEREHESIGPVALLEDQDVTEAAIPRQHGRQRRHRGQLDDQRGQQKLFGAQQLGFRH